MPQMVRDDSIGAALGALAGSMFPNPKSQAEAMFMRERILNAQADREKNVLETQNLRRQQGAQDDLIGQFSQMMNPQSLGIPAFVEPPLPSPDFNGPMQPVPNPQMVGINQKLAFANAAAKNAILRGGGPGDALNAVYGALGQGRVLAGGLPTDEATARQLEVQLTGKIGSAATPLTDAQRRVIDTEKVANEAQTKTIVPNETQPTYLGPAVGQAMKIAPNPAGQYVLPAAQTGPFAGNSMEAQNMRIIYDYNQRKEAGLPITPQQEAAYRMAWGQTYGPKEELRAGPNGSTVGVTVQPYVPPGITNPNGGAAPAPATGAIPSAPAGPAGAAAASVAATNAGPTTPAPAASTPGATGVRTIVPGSKTPTEAQAAAESYYDRARTSHPMLNEFTPENLPTSVGQFLTNPRGMVPEAVGNLLASPEAKKWRANAEAFITAALRRESGAAIGDGEYSSYAKFLIPAPGDDSQMLTLKKQYRESMLRGLQAGTISPDPERTTPDQLKAMIENQLRKEGLLGAAPAPAPAAAPTGGNYSDVDAIVGYGRKK